MITKREQETLMRDRDWAEAKMTGQRAERMPLFGVMVEEEEEEVQFTLPLLDVQAMKTIAKSFKQVNY